MTTPDLLALASRVEGALGADRELDARIWCALRGKKFIGWFDPYNEKLRRTQVEYAEPPKRSRLVSHDSGPLEHALPYTASLDAAMTLVQEGCLWTMDSWSGRGWSAGVWEPRNRQWLLTADKARQSATPALALTSAALRSLAMGRG